MIIEVTKILSNILIAIIDNLIVNMDNRINVFFNNYFDIIDY